MISLKTKNLISLFTGAGGIDVGLEKAGFTHRLCVENDKDCLFTLSVNRPGWLISDPNDICKLDSSNLLNQASLRVNEIDLLVGGAPCQPFSMSGYWVNGDSKRLSDKRASTIYHFMRIVEDTLPKVVLFENVKGIGFKNKDEALLYIKSQFEHINTKHATEYTPTVFILNAADYGVPQKRERLFLIAERTGRNFKVPDVTHVPEFEKAEANSNKECYRTAWDAIGDLDGVTKKIPIELQLKGKWTDLIGSIPEGQNYLWHTEKGGGLPIFGWRTRYWSFLLKLSKFQPSWTLQASPGPATGPFHWKSRLLSVRELCRLQTFPDNYNIQGNYRSVIKQVGNSIPPAIGELLGKHILNQFFNAPKPDKLSFIPRKRGIKNSNIEKIMAVPPKYKHYIGEHAAHPGVGKGPRMARMK